MSKKQLDYGNYTDQGKVYDHNEDSFISFTSQLGSCFLVCDGIGGHGGGEVASQLAVQTIQDNIQTANRETGHITAIRRAIESANTALRSKRLQEPALSNMGCTCVLLLIDNVDKTKAWVAHVGDSRAYRIRGDEILQLTRDHSKVMEMVAQKIITMEEAKHHPQKNIILRALGIKDDVQMDIKEISICKKDKYLICSDGVSDLMDDEEILSYSKRNSIEELPKVLVDLANERGGPDNATLFTIEILQGIKPPKIVTTRNKSNALMSGSTILAFVAGIVITIVIVAAISIFNNKSVQEEPAIPIEIQTADSTDLSEPPLDPSPGSPATNSTNSGTLIIENESSTELTDTIPILEDSLALLADSLPTFELEESDTDSTTSTEPTLDIPNEQNENQNNNQEEELTQEEETEYQEGEE